MRSVVIVTSHHGEKECSGGDFIAAHHAVLRNNVLLPKGPERLDVGGKETWRVGAFRGRS